MKYLKMFCCSTHLKMKVWSLSAANTNTFVTTPTRDRRLTLIEIMHVMVQLKNKLSVNLFVIVTVRTSERFGAIKPGFNLPFSTQENACIKSGI